MMDRFLDGPEPALVHDRALELFQRLMSVGLDRDAAGADFLCQRLGLDMNRDGRLAPR